MTELWRKHWTLLLLIAWSVVSCEIGMIIGQAMTKHICR